MTGKMLLNDVDQCIGCFTCETACKQEHNLPAGVQWIKVVRVGPKEIGGKLYMDFVPMHCRHCENPPCIRACTENAITKRADGIVIYHHERCIGCKECIEACPFGAVQYNPELKRAEACNMCVDRLDRGLQPACVQHCPTQAIVLCTPQEYTHRRREQVAQAVLYRRFPDAPVPF